MGKAGLSHWDPSVSPKLAPEVIFNSCRVPFAWRLPGFSYAGMSRREVREFVFNAAANGASTVFTTVEGVMCNPAAVGKVLEFVSAAKEVKALLDRGAPRSELPAGGHS
jgi:hypothetical protein